MASIFCPLDLDGEPALAKLAKAVTRRSARLGQDGARCRKFYKKLFEDFEYAQAVRWQDIASLAERIARGR